MARSGFHSCRQLVVGARISKEAARKGNYPGGACRTASAQNGSPRMNAQFDDSSHDGLSQIDGWPY